MRNITRLAEQKGDVAAFGGQEQIFAGSGVVYELTYHGGLFRED